MAEIRERTPKEIGEIIEVLKNLKEAGRTVAVCYYLDADTIVTARGTISGILPHLGIVVIKAKDGSEIKIILKRIHLKNM